MAEEFKDTEEVTEVAEVESEGSEDSNEQSSYLDMSDEDMLKAEVPSFAVQPNDSDDEPEVVGESEVTDDDEPGTGSEEEGAPQDEPGKHKSKSKSKDNLDYKAAYERMLAPFKANGRDVQVNSVDDAIALMQMGANYNKKMAGLKPNLKLLKMLENSGVLSEEKLSYLIDLEKKNPDAINKLVKDSGLDPLDFDAEKAATYTPKNHSVDDREMELDSVLDEIQATPTYSRTLALVTKEWDVSSKQVIADHPQLLRVINGHMQSGIYDAISNEVERERMLGRLEGLSDIEAYRQVGDALNARGTFNSLGRSQGQASATGHTAQSNPKMAEDTKRQEKRRAAAPTKATSASASLPKDFNPLALSDEDFAKMAVPVFR